MQASESGEEWITYLGVVLAGMRTTRLLACCCSSDGLHSALEKVTEFQRLDQIPAWKPLAAFHVLRCSNPRIPNHAPVLNADLVVCLEDLAQLLDTLVERLLGTVQKVSSDSEYAPLARTGRRRHQPAWPSAYPTESWRSGEDQWSCGCRRGTRRS